MAYVRFCLVGADHADPDEEVGYSREVVNCVWFLAFDEIADRIATHGRKGHQLSSQLGFAPRFGRARRERGIAALSSSRLASVSVQGMVLAPLPPRFVSRGRRIR